MTTTRPKFLTRAEARTLTRSQILTRIEAEQAYFDSKRRKTPADHAAIVESFSILRAAIDPVKAVEAATDGLNGVGPGRGERYMDQQPDIPDALTTGD